ncbi:protein trichome birefringence-like 28 [Triticum dicoccoides]|uniref:protein trichome birefringence-like 28 n=1 Tax=Triticum dicoccoides TaxID=85692 RepID=UPI00188F34ED|nr:protein trichome birefringence-like 28 [Triticum dicoccoides]
MLRRKSPFAAAPAAAKQGEGEEAPARRPGAPLSLAGLLVSIFLVAIFLYNEDSAVVKAPIAADAGAGDFPLAGASRARSAPDLHLLHEVNSRPQQQQQEGSDVEERRRHVEQVESGRKASDSDSNRVDAPARADKRAAPAMTATTTPPPSPSSGGNTTSSSSRAAVAAPEPPACNLYQGWWTYDAEASQVPLYREPECEFLTEQVTCMRNGRRDDSYQRWRWQPSSCDLPRFDARALLERLRNKRLMFVGDSLNRNQWESMVCLVSSAIPSRAQKTLAKFVGPNGSLNVFRAAEYNATVEFYWAPFLVSSNSDDPQAHSVADRVIAWRSIAKHARHWRAAHFLVFNTYIWWLNNFEMKVLKNPRAMPEKYTLVDRPVAYKEVLKTWAKWVDRHVDPGRTKVFFMGMSPNHGVPDAWGGGPGAIKCAMETQPILNHTGPLYIGTDWRLHGAAEAVLRSMRRVPVHLVDITALSEFRKDAHTSVHTLRQGKLLTPEQQADPRTYADCIHWCLPGLPDTWNHFLYAQIVAVTPPPAQPLLQSSSPPSS